MRANDWNINTKLSKWFQDPCEFRSVQARCDALIIGTFARHFFMRITDFVDPLVMRLEKDEEAMHRYLAAEGYSSDGDNISPTWRKHTADGNLLRIFSWIQDEPAILRFLTSQALTSGLNVISWNKAYSFLPYSTFIKKEAFMLLSIEDKMTPIWKLYVEDGIRVRGIHWQQRDVDRTGNCDTVTRPRRIGDRYTWTIDLDTDGVEPSGTPDEVLESTTFPIGLPELFIDGDIHHYQMGAHCVLCHPVLRHRYVTVGRAIQDQSHYNRSITELCSHLNDATMFERAKMHDRPDGYEELRAGEVEACDLRGAFSLPASWIFCDEDVITFLDDAWKKQENTNNEEQVKAQSKSTNHDLVSVLEQLLQAVKR